MKKYICFILVFYSFSVAEFERDLQLQLILAEPGDTIQLDPGMFSMLGDIIIENKKDIVINGSGISNTILSFSDQVSGKNGFNIRNSNNIIIQNFTIQNAKGDAFLCENVNGLSFNNIKIEWFENKASENSINAFNIKKCEYVLIENCSSSLASDTGFFINQSKNVIIRFIEAFNNSIGIRVQNSVIVDLHSNNLLHNAAGLVIVNVPDLSKKDCKQIRVFDNILKNNNSINYSPFLSISSKVPSGTGIFLMAVEQLEVFNNTIIDNNTLGTAIFSYFITELETKDTDYSPYSSSINIYDNIYRRESNFPSFNHKIGKILISKFFKEIPDIITDGVTNPKYIGKYNLVPDPRRVCIVDNFEAKYVNLNIERNFSSWYRPFIVKYKQDLNECNCTQKELPKVIFDNSL